MRVLLDLLSSVAEEEEEGVVQSNKIPGEGGAKVEFVSARAFWRVY